MPRPERNNPTPSPEPDNIFLRMRQANSAARFLRAFNYDQVEIDKVVDQYLHPEENPPKNK